MQLPHEREWRNLALDPATDTPLYRSPRTGPGSTAARVDRGTDLFAHTAPSGTVYFYFRHWCFVRVGDSNNEKKPPGFCESRPAGTNICELTTADSAKHYLREQITGAGYDGVVLNVPARDPDMPASRTGQSAVLHWEAVLEGLEYENLMTYLPGFYRDVRDEHEEY